MRRGGGGSSGGGGGRPAATTTTTTPTTTPAWGGACAPTHARRLHPAHPPPSPARLPSPPAAGFGSGGGGGFGKAKPKKAHPPGTPVWVIDRAACPCGSGSPFTACCGPFIAGTASPPTPEALMRSRFAAYVKGTPAAVAYIVATTRHAAPTLPADVRATVSRIAWRGLTVLPGPADTDGKLAPGGATLADPDKGVVAFRATYKVTGQAGYRADGGPDTGEMVETSVFVREGGKWLYLSGEQTLNGGVRA